MELELSRLRAQAERRASEGGTEKEQITALEEKTNAGTAGDADTPDADHSVPSTLAEAWDLETDLLLEELAEMDNTELLVPMNVRMTATEAVSLRKDEEEFALRARRPIPLEPKPYAKRGTAFHNWVEQRYKQVSLPFYSYSHPA